jgi:hypothetical protein
LSDTDAQPDTNIRTNSSLIFYTAKTKIPRQL